MKKYTPVRKFYAWIGFTLFWGIVGFTAWMMLAQDQAVELFVKLFY